MCDEEREALPESLESVVMTTWHEELLAEALWYVLTAAIPDEGYAPHCRATVGVSIGSREWATEMRAAFSRPREFVAAIVDESECITQRLKASG